MWIYERSQVNIFISFICNTSCDQRSTGRHVPIRFEGIGISQAGIIENKPVYVDPYEETGQKAYHITYILNGRREQHFQP